MKKIILGLAIAILSAILVLIVIFVFNPFNSRTKLIGSILNSYLSAKIEGYVPLDKTVETSGGAVVDKNPLLNEAQEETLENLGVDVSKLPTEITPAMKDCFTEKLGSDRAAELVAGAAPSALDMVKAGGCLSL
jgi:hypothetical protein